MLHTLNKAWATIVANQIKSGKIEDALFVTSGEVEYVATKRLLQGICDLEGCYILDAEDVVYSVSSLLGDKVFDDVLVSHEAHGMMLHNFLAKHCRRLMHRGG